ncbi:MAG: hypothetical protein HY843_01395 [Bdellovibrio sp.]|nr:hypothetical protein [Bdellovibrio sp.]
MKSMDRKPVVFIFIFGVALIIFSLSALAADSSPQRLSRISSEIKGIKNSAAIGVLFGSRYMSYESESFSVGGAGYTGQISGGAAGSFSYGGILVGYTHSFAKKAELELSLLGGGAGGFQAATTGGGVVLEPSVALNFLLGKTVRICLNSGYAWVPSLTAFSGITLGLRFDFLLNGVME